MKPIGNIPTYYVVERNVEENEFKESYEDIKEIIPIHIHMQWR